MYLEIADPTLTEQITPFLPLAGVLAGGIVVGAFAAWNRRKGNLENRAPDVNELWNQQATEARMLDLERRFRRLLEDYAHDLWHIFRSYVRRTQGGGDTTLTPREQKAHDTEVPTPPKSTND